MISMDNWIYNHLQNNYRLPLISYNTCMFLTHINKYTSCY